MSSKTVIFVSTLKQTFSSKRQYLRNVFSGTRFVIQVFFSLGNLLIYNSVSYNFTAFVVVVLEAVWGIVMGTFKALKLRAVVSLQDLRPRLGRPYDIGDLKKERK